jgi:hypothetical protein
VFSISAGGEHSCAIENGKAYCWGDNRYGQLGDDSTVDSSIPVAVDMSGVLAGKTLIQISADSNHTCAVDSKGAGYCWGDNSYGELGDGSFTASPVPVAVDTSGVLAGKVLTQISAGGFTDDSDEDTCASDSTGSAYCWGYNGSGELGDGSFTSSPVPVAVDTSGVLPAKPWPRSPLAVTTTRARWMSTMPSTAGATTSSAISATTAAAPSVTCLSWSDRRRPQMSPELRVTLPLQYPGRPPPAWTEGP